MLTALHQSDRRPRPLVQLYKAVCAAAYNYKNANGVVAPTTFVIKDPLPLKVAFAQAAGLPYEGPFVSTRSPHQWSISSDPGH